MTDNSTLQLPENLTLTSPDALLASLPHLVGFTAEKSAIIVWLREGHVLCTERADLPEAIDSTHEWLEHVWSTSLASSAQEVIIVTTGFNDLSETCAQELHTRARECALGVRDVLVWEDPQWKSLLCTGCCPSDGKRIHEGTRSLIQAEMSLRGSAPLADRSLLQREVLPSLGRSHRVHRLQARAHLAYKNGNDLEQWRDRILEQSRSCPQRAPSGLMGSAVLGVALQDIRVRDVLLWEWARAGSEECQAALSALVEAVRSVPEEQLPAVATAAALLHWLNGDGARALVCLDVVDAVDPSYSLALLARQSIQAGLSPQSWRDAMRTLTWDECRHGTR